MSPDLRQQLLDYGSSVVDGVFVTHVHFDHVNGINELRPLFFENDFLLQIYGREKVMEDIRKSFFYLCDHHVDISATYRPYISTNVVKDEFVIGDITGTCFEQDHGYLKSTGIRIGNFAYSTDVAHLDEKAMSQLRDLDTWIVGCTSQEQRPSHASLEQVLRWVEILKPRKTFLTHMSISMDYETLEDGLPANIRPAYDQMKIIL
jgi:phosphoribosyl 1,2-cyclic phosphate phosphodiesterase